ncbi:MAG: SLBB domain-containing protein [Candidatus Izemoplasmatales bacterium]
MNWIKNNIGVVLILVGIIGFILVNGLVKHTQTDGIEQATSIEEDHTQDKLFVEIKGEVHLPGIYECNQDERVLDIINQAGGLTEYADVDGINRSQKLEDEMIIVIPRKTSNINDNPMIERFINVEVKGEVMEPGVYKLKENAIINDLIEEAGGLTINANTLTLNLAEKINEGDSILVDGLGDLNIYVQIKGQVKYPGVYDMQEGDLVIDAINEAGGLLENADTDEINLVEVLNNNQVINIQSKENQNSRFAVDIKGAVKNPGVYYFNMGDRILDIINLAGGFNEDADYETINLSEFVQDEQLITIPSTKTQTLMAVDLKGEVKYPGVYYLKEGSRVMDLIRLAGGFRPDADTNNLNLSQILYDEDLIFVEKVINTQDNIFVEIKGEVYFPGIYTMRPGDRLLMLVNRAGGFTGHADQDEVNLTRTINDEDIIIIPSINDEKIYINITGEVFNPGTYYVNKDIDLLDLIHKAGGLTVNADLENIDFYQVISDASTIHIPRINDQTPQLPNEPLDLVNINTANVETLQTLSGIGIILAERIIEYREMNDGFKSKEEIMQVSGIKDYIYEKIKDDITV